MSEETNAPETNDGSWSGLKKTIIGTLTTVITGGGIWLSTTLFGGHGDSKEEHKTEVAAPAPAPVIVNVQQNQENTQQQKAGGTTTIIKEKIVEKPAEKKEEKKKSESTDAPW
jgi:flagellar basal body-associated protein FliL